jgi:hypothetical protein
MGANIQKKNTNVDVVVVAARLSFSCLNASAALSRVELLVNSVISLQRFCHSILFSTIKFAFNIIFFLIFNL